MTLHKIDREKLAEAASQDYEQILMEYAHDCCPIERAGAIEGMVDLLKKSAENWLTITDPEFKFIVHEGRVQTFPIAEAEEP